MGAISPLGGTWPETWAALLAGRSAIRPIDHFDATGFPSTVAARIALPDSPDRRLTLALHAADEAWEAAGLDPDRIDGRVGVFVGAESGRASLETLLAVAAAAGGGETFDHARFAVEGPALVDRFETAAVSPATVAVRIAERYGLTGPVRTLSLACSSSSAAIVEAVRSIRAGRCDAAICGGVGADVDPLMLAGFGRLGALSARGVSRPFDTRRDGFVVGEGAAFLVLARDGDIELAGVGRTLDGHHLTKPHPTGDGARRAIRAALDQAGLDGVDHVQAHGTSTVLNDRIEAEALADLCPDATVSAVKGALGHWIAGAGALGALCAIEALRSGRVPETAGLEIPDPDCPIRHATSDSPAPTSVLVNAFAFGGANACLVFRR